MEKLQLRIKQITQKKYLPLWIFAAVQVVYHILMREPESSDAMWFFRNQLDAYSLKDYLTIRYDTWSSRFLIEGVLVYISRNILLWKVLDWVFWVFLAWAFTELFPDDEKETANWIIVGFLLIYPVWDLRTAGWIATSTNYTWPLALGIFSLHGAARTCYGKKTPIYMWVLYGLAALYGANMEQMSAVLLAVNFCAVVYFIMEKIPVREYVSSIFCFVIAAAEFVFIMTCPGNAARKSQEIINWMPNFESFHLLDKISMGFVDTMHHLIASGNLMYLFYVLLLAVLVFLKTKHSGYRCAALMPVILNIWLVFFPDTLEKYFPTLSDLMEENAFIDGSNYQLAANYIPTLLYLFLIGCMLLSLVIVCENYLELAAQTILLALGLATRVIMGFTPTIYVSQERTFLFLYMILGVSFVWLVLRNLTLLRAKEKLYHAGKAVGACMIILGITLSLAEIGSV